MAPLKSECATRKKPPDIHSSRSLLVNLPAGPKGLAFISLSEVQLPAKYFNRSSSAAGFGACGGDLAQTAADQNNTSTRGAGRGCFIDSFLLGKVEKTYLGRRGRECNRGNGLS